MKRKFEFIGFLNENLDHIMKISISTFILMTIVTLAGCDNQGTIPHVLAQIEGSHEQLEITCKRLTLVDNEGIPRLTLFTIQRLETQVLQCRAIVADCTST